MRYAQANNGQVSYGIEDAAYSKASATDSYFGLVTDDVEVPNPNEVTPMATGGGRRGPHVNAPNAKEYEFEIPFAVLDHNAPFEVALGEKTQQSKDPDGTADSGDEYERYLVTESDRLPTMTVEHCQEDLDLKEWFVGSKASLQLEAEQGEALSATLSVLAAKRQYDDAADNATDLSVPSGRSPYRFWMKGDVTLSDQQGSTVDTLATVSGIDLSWDNGLEAQHQGDGREAHAVAETTAAEKYDMSITVNVTDTDLYQRAAEDDAPVDVEIPFFRNPGASTVQDAMYIRLKDCTVTSAPVPKAGEGTVEAEIGLAPRDTEIEFRTPA
ncbi:phage tail tube protein [Halorussus salinus]|uniref:phage tail tube protein n=1 Tax=Halorussus salinus TaxID=1364935 RepID=UPI0010926BAA|nr:phage tail tube protein [Halorussus salinus]